jgi:hypothetical protein
VTIHWKFVVSYESTPSLALPLQGVGYIFLPPCRGKVRMGVEVTEPHNT